MSSSRYPNRGTQKKPNERIIPIKLEDSNSDKNKAIPNIAGGEVQQADTSVDDQITSHIQQLDISNDESTEEVDVALPKRTLPPFNVPEKIIIVLDRARDEIFSYFELANGTKYRPLQMIKNSLSFFLYNKHRTNDKHKFALMVLNESSASWVLDFTGKVKDVIKAIDKVEECETEDIFDLNSVFKLIAEKIELPNVGENLLIPPPFVVRTVFIYGRSFTMPEVTISDEFDKYLQSPYFTFDVAMTHEIPDTSNKVDLIFKRLQELDTKGFAYFFAVSRSSSELHLALAKLLAHPLQRPLQKDCNYRLEM